MNQKWIQATTFYFFFLLIFYMQWHNLGKKCLVLNIWEIIVKSFYVKKKFRLVIIKKTHDHINPAWSLIWWCPVYSQCTMNVDGSKNFPNNNETFGNNEWFVNWTKLLRLCWKWGLSSKWYNWSHLTNLNVELIKLGKFLICSRILVE